MRIPFALLTLTSLSSMPACGSDEDANIAEHRTRWLDRAPEQYVIGACSIGFARGCSREVVVSGRVIAAEVAFNPGAAWAPLADLSNWADRATAMFDAVSSTSGSLRRLDFDREWGFIREYYIDGGEEGWGERVSCFLPERVDLQSCGGPSPSAVE